MEFYTLDVYKTTESLVIKGFSSIQNLLTHNLGFQNCIKDGKNIDPACGTAGFLISSYKYILNQNKDKDKNSTLSSDERKRITDNFAGYDISPDMVRLSRVNMYLHKFTKPQISEYDTLSSQDKWNDNYDVILANPPFMTPKGGIIPHNRYRVKAKRAEVLFVDYIMEHLNPNGKAGVVVPEGIVFQTGNAYKDLRKYLVEDNYLYAVISLPAGVFNPYSGVKTSILLMDKTFTKTKDDILFIKINNDGFDLGAQRRETKGSDIPEAIRIIKDYQNGLDVADNNLVTIASKKNIAKQDYILVGERYKETIVSNTNYSTVELSEVCDILAGNSAPQDKELFTNGKYPFFRTADVGRVHLSDNLVNSMDCLNDTGTSGLKLFPKGTILFPKSRASTFLNHRAILGVDGYVSSHLACIICDLNKINSKYLYRILSSIDAKTLTADQAYPSLNLKQISGIKIPLPPLHIQEEIVKEIEGYQKIIDGARQIVENYKPTIKIDPSWEMVNIQSVCEKITDGTHQTPEYTTSDKGVLFLSSKNVTSGKIDWENVKYIPYKLHEQLYRRLAPQKNDVLLAKNGTTGVAALVDIDITFDIYVSLALLRPNANVYPKYLLHVINSANVKKQFDARLKGIGVPNLHLKEIKEVLIPLPSLDTQQQIVAEIEEEMNIIEQSKRLVKIFEQKIVGRIAEVWGGNSK